MTTMATMFGDITATSAAGNVTVTRIALRFVAD